MNAADPNRLCSICDAPRGIELPWTDNGGKPAHVRCALAGSARALEAVGMRPEGARGPGRPPLTPGAGKALTARIRLSEANLEEVGRLIAEGHGKNVSEAVRWLLDESAKKRREK